MTHKKPSILFVILFALIFFILLTVYFSIQSVKEVKESKAIPVISVISNNLGIRTKLILLEVDLKQYQLKKSNRTLRYLKKRANIMKGSILNDITSPVTTRLHIELGDINKVYKLKSQLNDLIEVIESIQPDNELDIQANKNLTLISKNWNTYTQFFIQSVQEGHAIYLDQLNAQYEQQFSYQVIIAIGSVFSVLVVLSLYFRQLKLSKQLIKSKLEAEASNLAKSTFLANMSHEIRTPLNGVIGMTGLAQKANHNPEVSQHLKKVIISSKCLLQVINDILDFSKIDANKLTLEHIDFDLHELLETHCATVYQLAQSKHLSFEIYTDAILPTQLKGDALRLLQILNNLGSNAIKFTDSGFVRLFVSYDQAQLRFQFCDSGIGMDDHHLETIFEGFNQADTSTTRKFGGTGLGLKISQNLAQLMNGDISVTSIKNSGSEFTLSIPIIEQSSSIQSPLEGYCINADPQTDECIINDFKAMGLTIDDAHFDYYFYNQTHSKLDVLSDIKHLQQNTSALIIALVEPCLKSNLPDNIIVIKKPYRSYKFYNAIKPSQINDIVVDDEPHISLEGLKILLVEDMEFNQIIAQTLLEEFGAQVQLAENGQVCLDTLKTEAFDLILMDIQMPVLDGISACQRIFSDNLAPNTPIIALTANVFKEDIERYKQVGMQAFIPKPFEQDDMLNVIGNVLKLTP